MDGFKPAEEMAGRAFALAYFIHGDRGVALSVVCEALSKLEVAAAAQVKRLYYTPTRRPLWRRSAPPGGRTRVSLSDLHLLQRLVYVESEPFERARERRREVLRDDDLLVHFVKHLIRISIRRNSFYVALGVSRLLHDYSTSETMEIYNVVVQDPERVKDDYYYRSRKGRLLQEVKERFEDFVSVCRVQRGEERFQTADSPGAFAELVAECLRQFSPWHSACPVPSGYDPTTDEIPTLSSAHLGDEDKAEINRIHAVVHPDCYELLTGSLRLAPPALRLSVPRFNLPNGKNNMHGPKDKPRRPAPPLGGDEFEALKRTLSEQSARRRATHASLLSVAVDRVERARLDLEVAGSVSVALDDGDELVEVSALDGDERTLLATHLLGGEPGEGAVPPESEVVLEGGQKLTFKFTPARAGSNDAARASLDISYRETERLKAAALFRRRLWRKINAPAGPEERPALPSPRTAFAALLLFVFLGALALYLFRGTRGPADTQLAAEKHQPPVTQTPDAAKGNENVPPPAGGATNTNATASSPPSSTNTTGGGGAAKNSSRSETARRNAPTRAANPTPPARPDERPRQATTPEQTQAASTRAGSEAADGSLPAAGGRDGEATRSFGQGAGATALSNVRKVFIEVAGDGDLGGQASRLLAEGLREGRRVAPTDVKDEADAAFKMSVSVRPQAGRGKTAPDPDPARRTVAASVRLVNEDGEVIWPAGGKGARLYTGTLKDVTGRIAADLLKDVLKSDARK
ncbi:MAG: hypothetical protein JOZ02_08510 [Acidobacteria bacterium]|nr:hypothetical protein [Acidobacteriota bacterium]